MRRSVAVAALAASLMSGSAYAVDLEVAHWWTSGGEAAAVAVLAGAWNATGNNWVDGAIAGSGDVARPIMLSRIVGGRPMDGAILNMGRDTEELIQAGLMTDLTDLSVAENWAEFMNPRALAACTVDGRVWCAPVMAQSTLWMYLNRTIFEQNNMPVPKDWDELIAAAPALRELGIVPLSVAGGWPLSLAMDNIAVAAAGREAFTSVYQDRSAEAAAGEDWQRVFEAYGNLRDMLDLSQMMPPGEWSQSVNQVISGQAAAVIMGTWAEPEFILAGQQSGVDYDCLPGLGLEDIADFSGDAMFFPKVSDPERQQGQLELAKTIVSAEVQVPFNIAKGAMPIRSDVDLAGAGECMQKGLAIAANPDGLLPSPEMFITQDTQTQIQDLKNEFMTTPDMTVADAQARFVEIIQASE